VYVIDHEVVHLMAPMHIEPFLPGTVPRPLALKEFEAVPISFAYLPSDQDPGRIPDHFLVRLAPRLAVPDQANQRSRLKVTVGVLIGAAIAFFST
jgi:hypothetical protein